MAEIAVSFNENPDKKPAFLTQRQTAIVAQLIGLMLLGREFEAQLIFAPEEMDWLLEHGFIVPLVPH